MGVMSRRVLPVCTSLCIFCPAMRASSRHPVKRYKKLLAEIFPRSQDAQPNDRKIGKLCEYASRNPLRLPKITDYLEQKFYKELRNGNIGSVKAVLLVYGKLLSSCKEQMSLFASSLLGIVRTLLEQTQQDEMQILGCNTIVVFINNQVDSTYMFNLEGLIPKLCQLAQEVGDDEKALQLRSAGLKALAFMVRFMGEQSHISMDFDDIISVTLENYMDVPVNLESAKYIRQLSQAQEQDQQVLAGENRESSFSDLNKKITNFVNSKTEDSPIPDADKTPSFWSRVCLHNMAQLAKEGTTMRRVTEPLFHNFDTENQWLAEKGLAFSVLKYLQSMLEESDDKSHFLLPLLVKHLDHKEVVKKPVLQMHIVNVTAKLSQYVKQQASVAIIGAINDLIKHLRKCIQSSSESSSPRVESESCYIDLQCALENCISNLSCKVGDVGPILDMMAVVLENIPTTTAVARATLSALCRTAQIISPLPNITYFRKAFPDALFHQLLLAMSHTDHETRVLAHRAFYNVIMPYLSQPQSADNVVPLQAGILRQLSQKLRNGSFSIRSSNKVEQETTDEETGEKKSHNIEQHVNHSAESPASDNIGHTPDGKANPSSLRLSSHQVSLLLSSIWIQATSPGNTPANFEAMAHTYGLALLFILSKNPNHMALVRCFQLAFSLRRISLDQQGLQPSRRRSLFILASHMMIVSAKAAHVPHLIPIVKSTLSKETMDPYLELVEDVRLQAIKTNPAECYGSQEDESAATRSLSAIELKDQELKETLLTNLQKLEKISEEELSNVKAQLSQEFSPDEEYPLGAPLFMETPLPSSPLAQIEFQAFDEVVSHAASMDDDGFPDPYGSQSDRKTSLSINSLDVLSVNQLLESVLETARQVVNLPNSSTPASYDQVKNQCEALVTGKQQKMSVLHSFKKQQEAKAAILSGDHEKQNPKLELTEVEVKLLTNVNHKAQVQDQQLLSCSREYGQQQQQQQSFRLPPSSPYDKFLKAAGC